MTKLSFEQIEEIEDANSKFETKNGFLLDGCTEYRSDSETSQAHFLR